jgi:hypothetical protein
MVTVYEFKYFDVTAGRFIQAPRPATLEAIRKARGEAIAETALEIDEAELDDDGFVKRPTPLA